jgi:predicted metalloprotease with PDZ domain
MRASAATLLLSLLSTISVSPPGRVSAPSNPSPSNSQLSYTITVDPSHINQYDVELTISHSPARVTLAMARHPEYDDRYWRFVTRLTATVNGRNATVIREDSARWRIEPAPSHDTSASNTTRVDTGTVMLRYRIDMPAPPAGIRPSWRSYVNANSALVGAAHSYIYPIERSTLPIQVHVGVPKEWKVATALEPSPGAGKADRQGTTHDLTARGFAVRDFVARDMFTLIDSPILAGSLYMWSFPVDGVRHTIAYAPLENATPFDTAAFVGMVRRMTEQSVAMFRTMPYRSFTFLFVDGAYGGLEHAASVSLGAPSATLARDMSEDATDFEHEFFHTWNLVAIHPVGRGGMREGAWPLPTGLWFSEGVTMYYSDIILRRAGIVTTPRAETLADQIGSYLSNVGNTHVSPERASMYSDELPGGTGDYSPSVHTQGQMIATVLDLMIRDSSKWTRSLDDAMRTMYRTRSAKGFTREDLVRAVGAACTCNAAPLFERYVANAAPLDFNSALRTVGLRVALLRDTVRSPHGETQADMNSLWGYVPPAGGAVRLTVNGTESAWGRAGLHTNDEIIAWNGKAITSFNDFRGALRAVKTGDTVILTVRSAGVQRDAHVTVLPEIRTKAVITEVENATAAQRAHRTAWAAAKPLKLY